MRMLLMIFIIIFGQSCSHVFYQPSRQHYVDPAQFKLKYEDVFFQSRDGTQLHGWFFPAKTAETKGTIVQFHGNAQNISTHFFSLIWLADHGYNLFTFDYRGYGKSKGEPSQKGIYQDALAALDKGSALNQERGKGKLIIYGQSLGGAISLRAVPDWPQRNDISLLVLDSTFSSYKDIAFNKLASRWFLLPFSPLSYFLISDKYAADEILMKIKSPTLVIVGMKDDVIPSKFGVKIFQELQTQKWLWKVPEGKHIDVFHHKELIFRKKFVDFLEQNTL